MFDVPGCFDKRRQFSACATSQHGGVGIAGASAGDLLHDLYRVETWITRIMADDNPLAIDVEKRTTRGRLCPRCGGKIIPSNRAVYQTGTDPEGSFPLWTCERCGYEEVGERRKPAGKAKH